MKLKGRWWISLYGPELKEQRVGNNVITQDGVSFVASFLGQAAASATAFDMKYIAVGTDSSAEADTNTALGTEAARVEATVSNVTGAIYRLTATFTSGVAVGAITEYGVFSSATSGTMLSRDVEGVINVGTNDTLTAITEITLS